MEDGEEALLAYVFRVSPETEAKRKLLDSMGYDVPRMVDEALRRELDKLLDWVIRVDRKHSTQH